jgi:outer membrane lipoprotein-sorting protein
MIVRVLVAALLIAMGVQPRDAPSTSGLAARLEAFDQKTRLIEDLSATFEQQKHSALLRKPLISRGRVRVKGDVIRWDTREPIESVIRMDDREARVYYPDQKSLEVYPLVADLRFLAGSPVPRLTDLELHFDIGVCDADGLDEKIAGRPGSLVVELIPKEERLRERVTRIRLVLDEQAGVMRLFELTDPSAELTVIKSTDITLNAGLTDEDVALVAPPDVTVSYPLGPTEGAGEPKSAGGAGSGPP